MADHDLIRRTQAAARRSVGHASVEDQSRWHRETLAADLGIGPDAPVRKRPSPPISFARVLLTLIAAMTVSGGGTAGWILWQRGTISAWIEESSAPAARRTPAKPVFDLRLVKALGYDQAEAPPPPDEPEAAPAPQPAPRPRAVESDDTVNSDPFDSKSTAENDAAH